VFQKDTGRAFLDQALARVDDVKRVQEQFLRFVGSLDRDREIASVLLLKFLDRASADEFVQELRNSEAP
jgi:hypothetical protein